ncbi:TPA: hypothetical protein I7114_07945 [Vibrio vulnificus]|nr:hypothetical protein [Vibrio vulnificus]
MPLPPYAKTTIRLAFGSKRQTEKLAHLLFGFSIEIQRWQALPVLDQSKTWHFLHPKPTSASKYKPFDFLNPECKRSFGVSIFLALAKCRQTEPIWTVYFNQLAAHRSS